MKMPKSIRLQAWCFLLVSLFVLGGAVFAQESESASDLGASVKGDNGQETVVSQDKSAKTAAQLAEEKMKEDCVQLVRLASGDAKADILEKYWDRLTHQTDGTIATPSTLSTATLILEKFGITPLDGSDRGFSPDAEIRGGKWEDRSIQALYDLLGALPESFRTCTKRVEICTSFDNPKTKNPTSILGYYDLSNQDMVIKSGTPQKVQSYAIHEMTHAFQRFNPQIGLDWLSTFWPEGRQATPSVSLYGNTNGMEDMAESVREYWDNGAHMAADHPERYAFVRDRIMGGVEFIRQAQ